MGTERVRRAPRENVLMRAEDFLDARVHAELGEMRHVASSLVSPKFMRGTLAPPRPWRTGLRSASAYPSFPKSARGNPAPRPSTLLRNGVDWNFAKRTRRLCTPLRKTYQ